MDGITQWVTSGMKKDQMDVFMLTDKRTVLRVRVKSLVLLEDQQ